MSQEFDFAHAPTALKVYAKEILKMTPKTYSFVQFSNDAQAIEYTLKNSRRTEVCSMSEVNEYYQSR